MLQVICLSSSVNLRFGVKSFLDIVPGKIFELHVVTNYDNIVGHKFMWTPSIKSVSKLPLFIPIDAVQNPYVFQEELERHANFFHQ
jgi:hypothetical protein